MQYTPAILPYWEVSPMMHPQQEPDHQPQAVPPMPMNPTPDIPPESLPGRGDAPTEHAGEFF